MGVVAPLLVVALAGCGDDGGGASTSSTSTTATSGSTPVTTRPTAPTGDDPVETVDAALLTVDVELGQLEVRRLETGRSETLVLDGAAEVTVQGPVGPVDLPLADLSTFVDRRRAELGETQADVAFAIEITGRGPDQRVTALREIPPG